MLESTEGGWSIWSTPLPYPDYYPEKAEKIRPLVKKLWGLPYGSEEAIQTAKKIQEIYVPQLYMIPLYGRPSWYRWNTKYWVNFPTADDPHEHQFSILGAEDFLFVKHLQPRSVEVTDFAVTPGEVKVGEPATAKITLKNTGDYDHKYNVYIRKGSAKVGPGPEILAHSGPIVPSGGTKTIELEVTFDEPGSYTLTVDDWRLGDTSSNPGEPIEKSLIVEKAGKPSISPTNLTLSKAEVEPGESTTISVDVSNNGDAEGSKTVEITLDGETIKSETVTLKPGETTTVSTTTSKSAEGTYTVKAGELTRTFTVKKRGVVIPPGLEDKVTLAIRMAENARSAAVGAGSSAQAAKTAANEAKKTAQEAVTTAQEAKSAAESAESAAQEAKTAAQEARDAAKGVTGGVSASMLVASMIVTIIVVLAGVYVITRKQVT
ncbi:hypothetical protein AKJ41_05230 [candidate division MSBL1 archaeon SCGC-AAA259O05]|uniref:CARDB domain-containing protein n=1 Tax=candidate division MSBL1 archaeon SCGC-AAA259O05 TaxID=1698271 RepID=A0A133UZG5_9EURY|nr:hypothetical protein AKJ41_05230 [candidate division MSBL1 archaeon SCGC-AAA259O05]